MRLTQQHHQEIFFPERLAQRWSYKKLEQPSTIKKIALPEVKLFLTPDADTPFSSLDGNVRGRWMVCVSVCVIVFMHCLSFLSPSTIESGSRFEGQNHT